MSSAHISENIQAIQELTQNFVKVFYSVDAMTSNFGVSGHMLSW
jgi:hypothetical protein